MRKIILTPKKSRNDSPLRREIHDDEKRTKFTNLLVKVPFPFVSKRNGCMYAAELLMKLWKTGETKS